MTRLLKGTGSFVSTATDSAPFFLLGCLLLSGCLVGPDYAVPPSETPAGFTGAKEVPGAVTDKPAVVNWWSGFNDPMLNKLISQAVAENRSIDQAIARLNEARAALSEAKTDIYPSAVFNSKYSRDQTSQETEFTFGPRTTDEVFAGFDASWELDFFGRIRRHLEGTEAEKEGAEAELDDVLLSVLAEVARNYIQLRGDQLRLGVSKRNLTNQEETVRLTEAMYAAGASNKLESLRARAQLETIRSTIPPIEAEIRSSMYRLAVLTGRPPAALVDELTPAAPLPQYAGPLTIDSPGDVIKRRPDIRTAERALAASTADIGIYTAELYPRVAFEGTLGYRGSDFYKLGDAQSDFFSIGPRITWPAFELNKRWQEKLQADARAEAALAAYQQTVLLALEDVENSLVRFTTARVRHESLVRARDQNREAFELAQTQYRSGSTQFLDVLDSERALFITEDQVAVSETELVTRLVAIYKSLGGGWEHFTGENSQVADAHGGNDAPNLGEKTTAAETQLN